MWGDRTLIDIIDAANGKSLLGDGDKTPIELCGTIYEDQNPDLANLMTQRNHSALVGLVSCPVDLLLLGAVVEQSTGMSIRYVQYWRYVNG